MNVDVDERRIKGDENDRRMVASLVEHGAAAVLDAAVDGQGFNAAEFIRSQASAPPIEHETPILESRASNQVFQKTQPEWLSVP